MKIVFTGGLFPKEEREHIIVQSKGVIQFAADALQWSFVDGLHQRFKNDFSVFNMPHIGSFPFRYKKLFLNDGSFGGSDNLKGTSVGFCNLLLYKKYSQFRNLEKSLDKEFKLLPDDELKIIVVYAMITPFLLAASRIKKSYKNVKIILIVPDLPEFMSENNSIVYTMLKKIDKRIQTNGIQSVDGYILLTEQMNQRIPNVDKPYSVIEGIFNPKDDLELNDNEYNTEVKTIFYSGTLARRYGILTLVEAFRLFPNEDYRLVICGDGDALAGVLQAAKDDKRIIYKGQLDRTHILKLQKVSTVLVNPRSGEGAYTAFSFPSKTMEYLASGTPVVLCKLPGIPNEYYNYCFALDVMNVEHLHKKIKYVLSLSDNTLASFGVKAKQFIADNKTPYIQTKKIEDLIKRITNQ